MGQMVVLGPLHPVNLDDIGQLGGAGATLLRGPVWQPQQSRAISA